MRKVGFVLCALVLLAIALGPAFAAAAQPFSDVPRDHWAYNAIERLSQLGVVEGYPDGTYKGKRTMTRYEFAVAIARIMDRVEQMGSGGAAGGAGPQGAAGEQGPAGPAGEGLTPEQKALLDKLANEFAPELKSLRSDLDALTKRVEELEANKVKPPAVTVSGSVGLRMGTNGTKISATEGSSEAGAFTRMRTYVNVNANLGSDSSALVSFKVSPETDEFAHADQMWFKTATKFITPLELTVGKQYLRRAQGLLFDNNQAATSGFRADFGTDKVRVGAFLGMLDRLVSAIGGYSPSIAADLYSRQLGMYGASSTGQDQYRLVYGDFEPVPGWRLGGNWLETGFERERGWSASLTGSVLGAEVYSEYARLTRMPTGLSFDDKNGDRVQEIGEASLSDSNKAWLGGVRWGNKMLRLCGEYGQVDAGYALAPAGTGADVFGNGSSFNLPLSALHPLAEVDPYDIFWLDRGLFLDPTNIAKGWHVALDLPSVLGPKTPISFSYAKGDAYNSDYLDWLGAGGTNQSAFAQPAKWRDADPLWWVKVSHQINDAVTASLLYGRHEVDKVMNPTPGADPIQVLRAEVGVQF